MAETKKILVVDVRKNNAYWNGEPCYARRVKVKVGTVEVPTWWCAGMEGTIRNAVEVNYGPDPSPFFLDDENGRGWAKVTLGYGSPQVGHYSLPDDSEVIEEITGAELAEADAVLAELLEVKRQRMIVEANASRTARIRNLGDFRSFHDEFRRLNRMGTRVPVSPRPATEVRGKAAKKAAKRERVKALKAAQSEQTT